MLYRKLQIAPRNCSSATFQLLLEMFSTVALRVVVFDSVAKGARRRSIRVKWIRNEGKTDRRKVREGERKNRRGKKGKRREEEKK